MKTKVYGVLPRHLTRGFSNQPQLHAKALSNQATPKFPTVEEQRAFWEKHDNSDFSERNSTSERPSPTKETDNDYIGELEMFLKYDV